jgi:hypothetical protein
MIYCEYRPVECTCDGQKCNLSGFKGTDMYKTDPALIAMWKDEDTPKKKQSKKKKH